MLNDDVTSKNADMIIKIYYNLTWVLFFKANFLCVISKNIIFVVSYFCDERNYIKYNHTMRLNFIYILKINDV